MGITISHLAVRRAVLIDSQPKYVWHEFEDIRRMNSWFGSSVEGSHAIDVYEPGLGGRIELSVDIDGETAAFGGSILVFDEGRELSFEDNWFGPQVWSVPTVLTLRLSSVYDGTLVELFHHGFERLGTSAAAEFLSYEAGWDTRHLARLKQIVEGP